MTDKFPYRSYTEIFMERQARIIKIQSDPILQLGCKEYYRGKPVEFIEDWGVTLDPRNALNPELPSFLPFILFDRQKEMVDFVFDCLKQQESGLVEKSRDMGASWLCVAISIWIFLFYDDTKVGWGSRKEQYVDQIGNPDSIFEKLRTYLKHLPKFLYPDGFDWRLHSGKMKLYNPERNSSIIGEIGDGIGRGGRTLVYFKDESAHYEHPELIESNLEDNTNVAIDISSVNGPANVFARRRQHGVEWEKGKEIGKKVVRVFVFDWRQNPLKNEEWYLARRKKAEREGLLHKFSQEVDRDYTSSVTGVLIKPIWVKSAIDLHLKYPEMLTGKSFAGLDIADEEEGDAKALALRKGVVLTYIDEWHKGDAGQATMKAVVECRQRVINTLCYDCIGVGATAKSEVNRLRREGKFNFGKLEIIPWAASAKVLKPEENTIKDDQESPKNKDTFKNLKAQAYWSLRTRFEKTYKVVYNNESYPIDELISIDSTIEGYDKLIQQLSQPTFSHDGQGRILVDKNPDGVKSPDLADAVNMAFFPVPSKIKKVGTWG